MLARSTPSKALQADRRFRPQVEELEIRLTPTTAFALLTGNRLAAFDTGNPPAALTPVAISGVGAGESLVSIDVRPQNGLLYGLSTNGSGSVRLYGISTQTGVATPLTAGLVNFTDEAENPVPIEGATFEIDFDPTDDRLRVVTDEGFNFRVDPNTGQLIDSDGESGSGINPDAAINGLGVTGLDGTAFTSNSPNAASTSQYTIDLSSGSLYIQNPPISGTQTSSVTLVPSSGLTIQSVNGFDISSDVVASGFGAPVSAGVGFVLVRGVNSGGAVQGLASVDLVTGAIGPVSSLGGLSDVLGLALQPTQSVGGAVGTPAIALTETELGTALVRFNTAEPGTVFPVPLVPVAGLSSGERLVGIDYRPATGQLFGLGYRPGEVSSIQLYRLDPQSNVATPVGDPIDILPLSSSDHFGFDFDPTTDRIRVVTESDLNFRLNPNDGTVDGIDPPYPLPPGLEPPSPSVTAAAFTNSFGQDPGLPTTLYTLDATTDTLSVQFPVNSATQTQTLPVQIGTVALDFSVVNGFDIPSNVRVATSGQLAPGFGYALLSLSTEAVGLFSIDLSTGEATALGSVGGFSDFAGLTLAQTPVGTVSFGEHVYAVTEGTPSVLITLNRSEGSTGAASVTVSLGAGGTAGSADATLPVTATFGDGETSTDVLVTIADDTLVEGTESLVLTLTNPTNGLVLGNSNVATVVITDNDVGVSFGAPVYAVTEGAPGVLITLNRSEGSMTGAASVAVSLGVGGTAGAADATLPVTATFGEGETITDVLVPITDDALVEGTESLVLTLTDPTNGLLLGDPHVATVTITDNDIPVPPIAPMKPAVVSFVVGTGVGGNPSVAVFDASGALRFELSAFAGGFVGGVAVALGDVTRDGVDDVVVGTASGSSHVKVFDGVSGAEVRSFLAFAGFAGGVSVAAGDVTRDGVDDVIVGTAIGAAHVKAFDGVTGAEVRSFIAFAGGFAGGVAVALGDVTRDGVDDVVVGTASGSSHVKVFDGVSGAEVRSFLAFAGFAGGVSVAAGDIDGDGQAELIVGAGPGGRAHVKVFAGPTAVEVRSFLAFDAGFTVSFGDDGVPDGVLRPGFTGSVRVASRDLTRDGAADVIVGAGPGGGPDVDLLDGTKLTSVLPRGVIGDAARLLDTFAFDPLFAGGVFVA